MYKNLNFIVGYGLSYLINGEFEMQCNFSTRERRDYFIHHKLTDMERLSMVKFLYRFGGRETIVERES